MDYTEELIRGIQALGEVISKVLDRVEQLEKEIETFKQEIKNG